MRNDGLIKTFYADAAIAANTIVKAGSADNKCAQSTAVADKIIGVSDLAAGAAGDRVDVIMSGIAQIKYGGTIARGDLLTVNASGQAVTAAPAAGTNNRIIGVAMESGVSGDLGSVMVQLGTTQG